MAGRPEFDSRQGKGFSFSYSVQSAVGLVRPPILWGPGAFSMGVNREASHTPVCSAEFKNVEAVPPHNFLALRRGTALLAYFTLSVCLSGAVLSP
jgi:hypothetical protein